MHVLTLTTVGTKIEIHALDPGENFPGFGGSRTGLTVRKTSSLIVRTMFTSGVVQDVEYDVKSEAVWGAIAGWINQWASAADKVVAETVFVVPAATLAKPK